MTKKELAAKLADKTGLTNAKATEVVNAIFDATPGKGIIAIALDAGEKVTIPGFGTFSTRTRAERTALNPATRKKVTVPKRTYVTFKVGKTLKERCVV